MRRERNRERRGEGINLHKSFSTIDKKADKLERYRRLEHSQFKFQMSKNNDRQSIKIRTTYKGPSFLIAIA